jgi:hypothetical protein
MKEGPVLFNAEMVRAILDGRKTQTRRPVKPQPYTIPWRDAYGNADEALFWRYAEPREDWPYPRFCPLGQPGDHLWVREPARVDYVRDEGEDGMELAIRYMADDVVRLVEVPSRLDTEWQRKYTEGWPVPKWVSECQEIPNGVFREASRITLEITDVRVERVQDISEADAMAEGSPWEDCWSSYLQSFEALWCRTYGPQSWSWNLWVWVIEFRRVAA